MRIFIHISFHTYIYSHSHILMDAYFHIYLCSSLLQAPLYLSHIAVEDIVCFPSNPVNPGHCTAKSGHALLIIALA